MDRIVTTLKDPATYAGLGVLAVLFGIKPEVFTAASDFIAAGAGLLAIILKAQSR
ncbi:MULTISPECIES: hypothetical protein [unclassified Azospirillum]|uniref:hypothetical protein n=1 Tax=unclassified Azospirillum TaxID=2630922 RepID=UPI001304D429|nr:MULTISPECIES: hypothetical protein [unclassified Azospirillum]